MSISIYAMYALVVASISGIGAAIRYWRTRGNQTWRTVEGCIFQSVYFTEDAMGRSTGNYVRVMYSYQVNGEFYAGEIVRSFATESEADQFSELFKKDLAVLVRVHPEKPELSILREEDNAGRLAYAAGTLA